MTCHYAAVPARDPAVVHEDHAQPFLKRAPRHAISLPQGVTNARERDACRAPALPDALLKRRMHGLVPSGKRGGVPRGKEARLEKPRVVLHHVALDLEQARLVTVDL